MDASGPGSIDNFGNVNNSPLFSSLRKSPASLNLSSLSELVEAVAKVAISSNESPNTTNVPRRKIMYIPIGLPIEEPISSSKIPKPDDSKDNSSKKRLSPEDKEISKHPKTE